MFFTLSAADLKWHDTIQAFARQSETTLTGQDVDSLSWEEKCAWYRLDCLMTDVILSDEKPLETVIHYFFRIEFQQRGSPHAHGVLWIKDAPHPEKSSPSDIDAFVDKYVHFHLKLTLFFSIW